jgi:hypothetical protein
MIRRLLTLAAILPVACFAQLQLFTYDGTTETPAAALTDVGSLGAGDTRDVRFRARNNTNAAIVLQTIALSGQGFSLVGPPTTPANIAPANFAEIRVRFTAPAVASYSATLVVNQTQTLLRAAVVSTPAVALVGATPLAAGGVIQFVQTERGQSSTRDVAISNLTTVPLTIQTCSISGDAFQAVGLKCPMQLAPASITNVTVSFTPAVSGTATGQLTVDSRTFVLSGVGLEPPLPKPTVRFDSPLTSGTQRRLNIQFDSVPRGSGNGSVTLQFQPASASMVDDPAIVFASAGARVLSFQVQEGTQSAVWPAGIDTVFQTGTTAGTLTFRVVLAGTEQVFTFPIAAAPLGVDSATAVRRTGNIDIALTGYDNTGTAGRFAFTFYDSTGAAVQPGAIAADWTGSFANYFKTSKAGGSFSMRATFPVFGDVGKITAVSIEATNSAGVTRPSRISF